LYEHIFDFGSRHFTNGLGVDCEWGKKKAQLLHLITIEMASLNTIATELLISILENLPTQDLLRIERTCTTTREAARTA
jgi:hypothetical protein